MKTVVRLAAATLALFAGCAWAQAPSDAQIASIVVSANQVDIDAGRLAESKGSWTAFLAMLANVYPARWVLLLRPVALWATIAFTLLSGLHYVGRTAMSLRDRAVCSRVDSLVTLIRVALSGRP